MSNERTYRDGQPIRHKIGECPACGGYVWAEVEILRNPRGDEREPRVLRS